MAEKKLQDNNQNSETKTQKCQKSPIFLYEQKCHNMYT